MSENARAHPPSSPPPARRRACSSSRDAAAHLICASPRRDATPRYAFINTASVEDACAARELLQGAQLRAGHGAGHLKINFAKDRPHHGGGGGGVSEI